MTTRVRIRDATETDALECGAVSSRHCVRTSVDREHHASAVDAMVRSCPGAREYRGAGRPNPTTTGRAPPVIEFVPSSVREPERLSSFFTGLARVLFLLRELVRPPHVSLQSVAPLHRVVLARRASREPGARLPSVPCSQPGTGDRAGSRFARSPPGLFATFQFMKSPRGVLMERGSEACVEVRKVGVATWGTSPHRAPALVLSRVLR